MEHNFTDDRNTPMWSRLAEPERKLIAATINNALKMNINGSF
jgi:hypothetical protein